MSCETSFTEYSVKRFHHRDRETNSQWFISTTNKVLGTFAVCILDGNTWYDGENNWCEETKTTQEILQTLARKTEHQPSPSHRKSKQQQITEKSD